MKTHIRQIFQSITRFRRKDIIICSPFHGKLISPEEIKSTIPLPVDKCCVLSPYEGTQFIYTPVAGPVIFSEDFYSITFPLAKGLTLEFHVDITAHRKKPLCTPLITTQNTTVLAGDKLYSVSPSTFHKKTSPLVCSIIAQEHISNSNLHRTQKRRPSHIEIITSGEVVPGEPLIKIVPHKTIAYQ